MSTRLTFAGLNLISLFVALILMPSAHAEQWDKKTVVTFSNAVEVPGTVLPAGTYVFKIADSPSDRRIVQIFTEDQRRVLATIQAVPDYRTQPSDRPVISFQERPSGQPEALNSWFYPGDNYGVHFVYPKSTMEPTSNSDNEVASSPEPATVAPLSETTAPMISELTTPPVLPVLAKQEPEPQVLAENTPAQPMQANLTMLPKTAGNYLVLPLLGLLFLASGSAILMKIRRTSCRAGN